MKIKIKAFASVKDLCGFSERVFDLPERATAADAVRKLEQECGQGVVGLDYLLLAVNEEYCRGERVLAENDVLALFPPVSGG
ncbi:MAG TPA: MoaD/ThiS family protein [Spirochaetota bacterium]|nr:MoaD/ThiS family protein [Spirochaetota bacterium]